MTDVEFDRPALEGFESVKKWKSRLASSSFEVGLCLFKDWLNWVRGNSTKFAGATPDSLIEFQRNVGNVEKYEVVDLVQDYVNVRTLRAGSKRKIRSAVRSFFAHSRAELPKDPGFTIRSEIPRVEGMLKVEDVRKVILSSIPMYQAVFTSMFQGGMGIGEFEHWNLTGWESLRGQLRDMEDERIPMVVVSLPGRKKMRNVKPFRTFIGPDAIERIRKYLPYRPRDAGAIFTNQLGEPVSGKAAQWYWIRHCRKVGLTPPVERGSGSRGRPSTRHGYNVHEMRDVFRSQWTKSGSEPTVAEYMMGHEVDPLKYDKAHEDTEWAKKQYRKALPMLQIMSSGRPFGQVPEDVLERELEERDQKIRELNGKLEEKKLEEASQNDDFQRQLTELQLKDAEKQRKIDEMTAVFEMAQRLQAVEMKLGKLIESAKEEG